MDEELVIDSLGSAIGLRQSPSGVIHHTDRGGHYASSRYRAILRRASMRQSMSGAGNCNDNAFMESCFGTLKTELPLEDSAEDAEAIRELGSYLNYYNVERLYSSLAYLSPCKFELQSINNQTAQK